MSNKLNITQSFLRKNLEIKGNSKSHYTLRKINLKRDSNGISDDEEKPKKEEYLSLNILDNSKWYDESSSAIKVERIFKQESKSLKNNHQIDSKDDYEESKEPGDPTKV